jgi:hypothetical protein
MSPAGTIVSISLVSDWLALRLTPVMPAKPMTW